MSVNNVPSGEGEDRARARHGARRLLIIEEDVEMRRTLRTFLHGEGFRVVEAGDAAEALARAGDGEYAGVVLDMRVGGDAPPLLPRIRHLTRPAPVVLMTAVPGRPDSRRASALGATGLLVKPFGLDDLLQLLAEVGAVPAPRPPADPGHAPPTRGGEAGEG
jgi:CheY-like chemotaxis protein